MFFGFHARAARQGTTAINLEIIYTEKHLRPGVRMLLLKQLLDQIGFQLPSPINNDLRPTAFGNTLKSSISLGEKATVQSEFI